MRILSLTAAILVTAPAVQALEVFQTGQVATAQAFNNNFSELETKIGQLEQKAGLNKRNVNGVEMTVVSSRYGYYSLTSAKGVTTLIDEDGYPTNSWVYYADENCTGNAYFSTGFDNDKNLNHQYLAKRLSPSQLHYDGSTLLMTQETEVVRLFSKSRRYKGVCSNTESTEIALKLVANDPAVTGFPDSLPYVISGSEQRLTLIRNIGTAPAGGSNNSKRNVYANGTKIGSVSYLPSSASPALYSVQLDDYQGHSVTLYKDGSYSGLNLVDEKTVYFIAAGCNGTPYLEVLDDYDREWWYQDRLKRLIIKNDGKYYQQSEQVYKMSAGAKSERWNSGSCFAENGTRKHAYRKLTETTAPDLPVFTPPITWDGYVQETEYSSLPEAD